MKSILTSCMLFIGCVVFSQCFFGIQTDNYSGVNTVTENPAAIVDSRFRTDVSILSTNLSYINNFYSFNINDLFNGDFDESENISNFKDKNSLYFNLDILGPSFMMNIKDNQSIALFTRLRGISHITNIDGQFLESITDSDAIGDYSIFNQNFSFVYSGWAEIGASYARVLMNENKHFLKGGINLKYIIGIQNSYLKANNLTVNFDEFNNNYTTTGEIETGNSNSFDNYDNPNNDDLGNGIGADLGLIYEYRPNPSNLKSENKYLLKIGLSITDLGYFNFKNNEVTTYRANATVSENDLENNSFDSFYTILSRDTKIKTNLPTAIRTNIDWNIHNKFYLNLNSALNVNKIDKANTNYIANTLSITPRYESKWFSAYLPVSYLQYSGFQAGLGFRAGPFFVGSGSVITGLLSETAAIDVNVGFKVPIFYGKSN